MSTPPELHFPSSTPTRLVKARNLRPAIKGMKCYPHADVTALAAQWPLGQAALLLFCPRHPRHPTNVCPFPASADPTEQYAKAAAAHPASGIIILSPGGHAHMSGQFSIAALDRSLLLAEAIAKMRGPIKPPEPEPPAEPAPGQTYPEHKPDTAAATLHDQSQPTPTPADPLCPGAERSIMAPAGCPAHKA